MNLHATVESIPAIFPGDIVEMKHPSAKTAGKVFKIVKLLNVNYSMVDENGQVWRAPFNSVKETDKPFREATFVPVLGSVVTIAGLAGYYVVIKISAGAGGAANVALLGGKENQYYKNIGIARMTDANGEVLGKL